MFSQYECYRGDSDGCHCHLGGQIFLCWTLSWPCWEAWHPCASFLSSSAIASFGHLPLPAPGRCFTLGGEPCTAGWHVCPPQSGDPILYYYYVLVKCQSLSPAVWMCAYCLSRLSACLPSVMQVVEVVKSIECVRSRAGSHLDTAACSLLNFADHLLSEHLVFLA